LWRSFEADSYKGDRLLPFCGHVDSIPLSSAF
jgi:hypothetical protein